MQEAISQSGNTVCQQHHNWRPGKEWFWSGTMAFDGFMSLSSSSTHCSPIFRVFMLNRDLWLTFPVLLTYFLYTIWKTFKRKLKAAIDENIPSKIFKRNNNLPWMTKSLRRIPVLLTYFLWRQIWIDHLVCWLSPCCHWSLNLYVLVEQCLYCLAFWPWKHPYYCILST
jgi:hypothetical protein